jgi:hypothetical protein
MELAVIIFGHNLIGLVLCAFYRYSNALPINEGYFLSKRWHIIISIVCGYVFLLLPPILAIYMSRVPIEDLKSILRKEVVTYVDKWGHDPPPHHFTAFSKKIKYPIRIFLSEARKI